MKKHMWRLLTTEKDARDRDLGEKFQRDLYPGLETHDLVARILQELEDQLSLGEEYSAKGRITKKGQIWSIVAPGLSYQYLTGPYDKLGREVRGPEVEVNDFPVNEKTGGIVLLHLVRPKQRARISWPWRFWEFDPVPEVA